MSLVGVILNFVLIALLLIALGVGLRLNRRLKALRDSQDGFAGAVRELNMAAARAEQGLADLRAATDEATDQLADRIEKGRALTARLDQLLERAPQRAAAVTPEVETVERRFGALLAAARETRPRERAEAPPLRREPPPAPGPATPPGREPRGRTVRQRRRAAARHGSPPVKSLPRILPLVGVAIGGVIAVNAMAGATDLPGLVSGARAFAEEAAAKATKSEKKPAKAAKAKDAKGAEGEATTSEAAPDALTVGTDAGALPAPTITPKAVCAPTAAELAKAAGLSPAELQVLQSLGERRGVLDKRESDLSTQLALMAAAEAKLDAKIRSLNGLKGELQGLLTQTDAKQAAEIDRLVKVFEGMKAKDAAPRMVALDDSVRIPIAAKMKERSLSAIVAQMPPAEAKKLTESLAHRFADARSKIDQVANAQAPAATPVAQAAAPAADKPAAPRKTAAKAPARKKAPPSQQAAAAPAAAAPANPPPAAPPAAASPPAAAPAAKAG